MRLHEYQSKKIYSGFGIPVPRGSVASDPQDAKRIADDLGVQSVVKAQVLVGGRGKAGGIRLTKNPQETEEAATQILGMKIKDIPVHKVLVEEGVSIHHEFYLGITNDRTSECPILIASGSGGMEIEEVAQINPEKIVKEKIDPLIGLKGYQIRDILSNIDLDHELWAAFTEIVFGLWRVYERCDASLVEINPLVITADNELLALDAKIVLDDNALFRHPDLADLRDPEAEDEAEATGRKFGLSFLRMKGTVGCLVNGAGLAMATMDVISQQGAEAANFLDIGGGASAEKVGTALKLILADPNVKSILINIFGGITRCDEVAKGILHAYKDVQPEIPIVVRLVGTNDEEGMRILAGTPIIHANTLIDGAEKAILYSKELER
jgi:succinyl-CoA synthetase beta subunit